MDDKSIKDLADEIFSDYSRQMGSNLPPENRTMAMRNFSLREIIRIRVELSAIRKSLSERG